tara:strand:+ start:3848 stop:4957 length:1110 start_codon:yes stop_codon:yes gene_type:complete
MLRKQDYSVNLGDVEYKAPPKKNCITLKELTQKRKKEACEQGKLKPYDVSPDGMTIYKIKGNMENNKDKLNKQYKENGCNPYIPSCIKYKTVNAKVNSLHDGNNEHVSTQILGLGLKNDGNVGNLYNEFKKISIVDTDNLVNQIREGNAPFQDAITKQAEYNAKLYYVSQSSLDKTPTGYVCNKCPPKRKICKKYPGNCKIPDPLNNKFIGIGSDLKESRENLQDIFDAQRIMEKNFQKQEGDLQILTNLSEMEMMADLNKAGKEDPKTPEEDPEEDPQPVPAPPPTGPAAPLPEDVKTYLYGNYNEFKDSKDPNNPLRKEMIVKETQIYGEVITANQRQKLIKGENEPKTLRVKRLAQTQAQAQAQEL